MEVKQIRQITAMTVVVALILLISGIVVRFLLWSRIMLWEFVLNNHKSFFFFGTSFSNTKDQNTHVRHHHRVQNGRPTTTVIGMTWQYSTINYLDRVVICYYTTSVIVFNQIPDRGGNQAHIATLFTYRQQRTTRGVAPPRWPGSRPHWGQLIIQRENRAKPCGGRHLSSLAGQA